MTTQISIEQIKLEAKEYKKNHNVKHTVALNKVAQKYGYTKFEVLKKDSDKNNGFIVCKSNDNNSTFNPFDVNVEEIINNAIEYAYEIGDKDECTDKHIAHTLSAIYVGNGYKNVYDYSTPDSELELDSIEMQKLYKLWEKVNLAFKLMITNEQFLEIISKNEKAYYFSGYTIEQAREIYVEEVDKKLVDSETSKKVLGKVLNILKEKNREKDIYVLDFDKNKETLEANINTKVTLNKNDIISQKESIEENLKILKNKDIIDGVKKEDDTFSITLNPKMMNFIAKKKD